MRLRDVGRLLLGREDAILAIAGDRRALIVGAVFVLSAALAREYDGADLLHEPWHLVIPFAASAAVAFVIYTLVSIAASRRGAGAPAWPDGFRPFLTLFWMTAPLAWLYAIPYERFFGPGLAMQINLWTLAVVAAWRVVLTIRFVQVLYGASVSTAIILVLAVADVVLAAATVLLPVPIIQVMGGVRLSPAEAVVQGTALLVGLVSFLSMPVWLIAAIWVLALRRPQWSYRLSHAGEARTWSPPLVATLIASIAVWIPLLWWAQPEQSLARRVEKHLQHGRIAAALELMSQHTRGDFPPAWDPPPWIAYAGPRPPIAQVMVEMTKGTYAPWVKDLFIDKFEASLGDYYHRVYHNLGRLPNEALQDRVAVFEAFGSSFSEQDELVEAVEDLYEQSGDLDKGEDPGVRKQAYRQILAALGKSDGDIAKLDEEIAQRKREWEEKYKQPASQPEAGDGS